MSRLSQYFLALKPRTGLWFCLQIAALTAKPIALIYPSYRPNRSEDWAMWAAIELAIMLAVLFVSGFVGKERDKNDDKYRGLNEGQRVAIVKRIGPISPSPTIMVHVTDTQDCVQFGRDLADTLERALVGPITMIPPVPIDRAPNPLPTGMTIVARADDARATAICKALREIAKIHVTLNTNAHEAFLEINVGTKLL